MSLFAKIMVVVNLILSAIFLSVAGTLHGATEDYRGQLTSEKKARADDVAKLDSSIKDLTARNQTTSQQAAAASERAAVAETKASQAETSTSNLNTDNAKLKAMLDQANTNINEMTKSNTSLNERVSALQNQLATSEAEKKAAMEQSATLGENLVRETARGDNAERSVAAAEAKNSDLSNQMDKIATQLAAYQKQFGGLGTMASMKAVKGVVSAASPKDDVYVLSVGSKDNVEVGYEFTVTRGSGYVAVLVVDTVYPNLCSAHVKPGSKKSDVQGGDSASTQL